MGKRIDWKKFHKDWCRSGQTVNAFCQTNEVSISGFYNGMKRNGLDCKRALSASKLSSAGPKFIKAVVKHQVPHTSATIELPNGVKISLDHVDEEIIRVLAAVPGGQ